MEVQTYLQEDLVRNRVELPDSERLILESAIEHHERQAALAGELGFNAQVRLHEVNAQKARKNLLPAPPFPEVSPKEYAVWRLFLPKSYPRQSWVDYKFDLIPTNVLEIIREHEHYFEELEIRTPEVAKTDPVIFGKWNGKRYMLARWSESRLLSFAEVKAAVKKTFWQPEDLNELRISILFGLACGIGALVFFMLPDSTPDRQAGIVILAVLSIISWTFSTYLIRTTRKEMAQILSD